MRLVVGRVPRDYYPEIMCTKLTDINYPAAQIMGLGSDCSIRVFLLSVPLLEYLNKVLYTQYLNTSRSHSVRISKGLTRQ